MSDTKWIYCQKKTFTSSSQNHSRSKEQNNIDLTIGGEQKNGKKIVKIECEQE